MVDLIFKIISTAWCMYMWYSAQLCSAKLRVMYIQLTMVHNSYHGNLFITGHGEKCDNNSDQSDDSTDYGGEVVYISDISKFKQSISVFPVTMVTS